MNAHESYVSLETAKMLKEAGFDWECGTWQQWFLPVVPEGENPGLVQRQIDPKYTTPTSETYQRPTLAVAQRWLREVKHYVVEVNLSSCYDHFFCDLYYYKPPVDGRWVKCMQEEYDTYEEALEKGIQKCLTILLED